MATACFAAVPYAKEPAGAPWLLSLVAVVSLAIGAVDVIRKYKDWAEWSYATFANTGVMVRFNGYHATARDVAQVVNETFDSWRRVFGDSKLNGIVQNGVVWVTFEPEPLESYGRHVAGYTSLFSRYCYVEFKDPEQDIDRTALAHEVGHIIQGEATGSWSESEHHKRSKDEGLR